jgi:predicted nucleotidyltransferase
MSTRPTDFDCVRMKNEIQRQLMAEQAGMSVAERRHDMEVRIAADPILGPWFRRVKAAQAADEDAELRSAVIGSLSRGLGKRLVAVALFGSRARGEARPDSDWDLLIVADGLPSSPFRRRMDIGNLLPAECRARVSVLPRTRAELLEHVSSLSLDIAVDGNIWHDPSGWLAHRLQAVRRHLEKAGLQRWHRTEGDVWIGSLEGESGWTALEGLV